MRSEIAVKDKLNETRQSRETQINSWVYGAGGNKEVVMDCDKEIEILEWVLNNG